MSILEIVKYPDPILRKKLQDIENIDEETKTLISDMADTMYEDNGVGLAANQVGALKRLIIFDPEPDPEKRNFTALINPHIVEKHGEQLSEGEGCLSLPGIRSDVKRYAGIKVEALDLDGNTITIEAENDLPSIILQHEIDHLDGIVFIDHISALKRKLYHKKLTKRAR